MTEIITVVVSLAVGAGIAWLLARSRWTGELSVAQARLGEAIKDITDLNKKNEDLNSKLEQKGSQVTALKENNARLSAQLENEQKSSKEKLDLLEKAESKLKEAFQALASDALSKNNQSFLELAKENLEKFQQSATTDMESRQKAIADMVKPVGETLSKVDEKLLEVEKNRIEAYTALKTQVESLATTQQQLQSETANLVKALRAPSVRGRWGEIQLKRVVEMAGMLEYCDFYEQQTITTEDGRLRPDMLVKLPGGKNVIVDAKVPLASFLQAHETADDGAREVHLKNHARQVRDHITRLGSKSYWDQFAATPEFVVMFLPGETFFSAALQHEPELIEFGVEQKVIPASPITLIALLRAVAYGWRQEKIAESAQVISDLGRELYDRIRIFSTHLQKVGSELDGAVAAYNKAIGSLEGRVLISARRFKELGAATSEDIPESSIVDTVAREIQAPELQVPSDAANAEAQEP